MDTPGKVMRPADIKLCVHKENNATSKGKSVYDGIPENEISSREDIRVGQLPTSVHCSDYLQQTLSDLMQLNPDDFIIHGDQQRQFSHHVLQDANSETVEDVVCGSSTAGSNLKVTTDGSCSNNNSRSVDITGENNDANDVYYSHIYDCIVRDAYPEGSSESYCTALKKRARHYCVINGTLYYNRKQPREVIIKKHQQQKILQNAHIESETGIHLGAKRMHEAISKTFFWRGMYMDIITFVRDCHTCAESFSESHLHSSTQSKLVKTQNDDNGDLHANSDNLLDADVEIRNGVWQKVVVKLCGPYPKTADENEYLITIVDPVSMWVCVKPTTNERNIKTVSTFIIKIFCLLGFAECCFIGFTTQELENVQQHCKGGMFESEITSCMFGSESRQRLETELLGVDECSWSTDLFNDFVSCYPSDWDRKVQSFLHTYHVSTGCDSLTPFYKLHGRNPKFILEANKENRTKDMPISKVPAVFSTREKSPNSVLQIHPNASEGAQQCGTLVRDDCSLLHRKFRRKIVAEGQQDGSSMPTGSAVLTERREYLSNRNQQQNIMKISQPSEIRANTVACVKKLLESAKEKKRKRGKYHKYSPEIREEIARYVAENGAGEAARCFSEKLGRVVSESTVRNIFKLHINYTPELKQEIGKYALTYGVQAASEHFTQKLGRAIRLGIVHKFKRFYLNQIPAQLKKKIHKKRSNGNRKRHYSDELKEEIGNYAFKYTVGAAIRHYSRKFGYPITETVVRRFRKMYLQKTFDKQSQWNQKQECLSSQQKGEQQQREREQQQIYLNIQENPVRNQIEQALPQNHVQERCTQSIDANSTMQTINILHSSMSVLNDPQFSDTPDETFPPPCEPAAVPSNCTSFDQHTNSALDIQPYIQCSGTVVSSALVFPSQFNNLVDNAPASTDPNIPVHEYQYNEMYSYYSELGQRGEISSVSGDNYISSQQLPALSNFSDAELTGKIASTLNGTSAPRKQQCFHLPNSSNLATDRYVSQIHSVLSQTGDVLFQQDGIQQLTDTNTVIQLNSDQIAGQNSDDILPISKQQGDKFQLHTIPLCYSDSNVPTKTSTEYSVNTLFDDQNNTFLMPHSGDCNISTYNKYNEVKAPVIPSRTAQPTVNEVNSTGCDITNGHSYSAQCSPSTMCSLTLQPLEPVVTSVLQIHETTAKLNSSPTISTLNSQNSQNYEQRSPISFVTSSTNASLTQKMLKTSITPTALVENAGTLHPELGTLPVNVPQNPVASLTSSLIKKKQVDTSYTMYSSCSVAVLKETVCCSTSHPPLVQAPVNQPTPLYTVATAASGTTTKSIGCAYAIPHAQVEKKKIKIPLMYFSQSQLTEPPPLVAISHSKTSVKQCPSHRTVHPVAPVTETFSAIESVTKVPPLAVVSYSTSSILNDSGQLQNSAVTYQSHSSGKQSPAYELDTALTISHHKNPETFEAVVSSEKTLDQRIINQTKLSGSESLVCPVAKAVMSSVSSSSNTDHIKNKFNSLQKKIPHTVASSSSLQYHGTNSQSSSSVVVSHQITPVTEVAITQATTAQTKPNSVENIHSSSISYSLQNINTLAAKQNRLASSCSLPHIVHTKVDVSSKIPQLSNLSVTGTRPSASTGNLSVTGTRPSASTVSVQALVAISDLKHTATNTSTNSHVILKSSETANECRPRVPTVLTSSPVTTAVPVNSVSGLTSGTDQSDTAGIPIINEYYNKQKDNVKNKYDVMTNLKHPSTCRGKDEIHNPVMTVATMPSYITVISSKTPVMNLELAIPCSSTVSNCTSTEGSSITSSTLTTTKSGNSCTNNNSWNGITRIPSGNNLSDSLTTMYFGNDTTSVSTMFSNKNYSVSGSTSLGSSAEVSSTNTSVSKTVISSAVHSFSNSVPEVCYSRAVLKLSESTSNNKNSSTSTDTTFCYKTTGLPSNTSTSHRDATYSSNISSSSKTTPLSANLSLMCTTSISPSTRLPIGLVTGASDITKGNKKRNPVATKNSNKKPLSRNFKGSKRGNYFAYSPELRAEMGKYAAEHGNQQACLYFKHILGVEVPSSTMRTLRDKYLLKLKHCTLDQKVLSKEVTSLGYGQRGRPMRLGKYDDEVRQCIQEIVKTGEPVSSYLVIETARQVLMQYEPSLLEENGGNIKLNVTWAKSFLKRTGIRNNS